MRRIRREPGSRTPSFLATSLATLALWGCGVEAPEPPSSTSSPGLALLAPEGGTTCEQPPPTGVCAEDDGVRCCFDKIACKYAKCPRADQVCKNNTCVSKVGFCTDITDCFDGIGTNVNDLVCVNNVCVPRPCSDSGTDAGSACGPGQVCLDGACFCSSNLGCDVGQVCDGESKLATCKLPIADEPEPGCSASGTSSSSGASRPALAALTLVVTGARRRRRPRR